jgi:hypothetical protein
MAKSDISYVFKVTMGEYCKNVTMDWKDIFTCVDQNARLVEMISSDSPENLLRKEKAVKTMILNELNSIPSRIPVIDVSCSSLAAFSTTSTFAV